MNQVSSSMFNGSHIIALADVSHCQRLPAVTVASLGSPKRPECLRVWLKGSTGMPPTIFLEGDEIESFITAWAEYRNRNDVTLPSRLEDIKKQWNFEKNVGVERAQAAFENRYHDRYKEFSFPFEKGVYGDYTFGEVREDFQKWMKVGEL